MFNLYLWWLSYVLGINVSIVLVGKKGRPELRLRLALNNYIV